LRDAFGLETGTQFHLPVGEGKTVLEPITPFAIGALHGEHLDSDLLGDLEAEHYQEIRDDGAIRA
jgi:hypothetical protein